MHKAEHVLSRTSQTASPLRAVRTVSHATSAPPVAMGNQAMQRLLIQAKLPVNQPGDSFEPKVDREAELAGHGGDPMLLSAATPNRSAVGSLQRLYVNQSGLQMRHSSGGRPVPSGSLRPSQSGILQRKCACGGSAGMSGKCEECSKKQRLGLQTKLQVNEPGDIYEREADRIADHVMAATAHPIVNGAPPRIQRLAAQPAGQMDAAPASVDQALASPGRPLEPALRQDMEQRFGHDFSRVRVHSGAAAEQSARVVNAHAYTVGHDLVFGVGRFAPGTHEGRRLLAHELSHVVQQTELQMPRVQRQYSPIIFPGLLKPTNYRFDTFQITESDLSDPEITARFQGLSKDQLRDYLDRVTDPAVRSYILKLLAAPELAAPEPPKCEEKCLDNNASFERVSRIVMREREPTFDVFACYDALAAAAAKGNPPLTPEAGCALCIMGCGPSMDLDQALKTCRDELLNQCIDLIDFWKGFVRRPYKPA